MSQPTTEPPVSKVNFKVTVEQSRSPGGSWRFTVGIEPVPVMKWHDVTNARAELIEMIVKTAGHVNRRQAILDGTMDSLRKWSNHGILFPTHWNDGDEYIPMLVLEKP